MIWASGGVVALALIGGGIHYATDGGREDGRSLDSACDGLLDTSELTDLLGADRLRGQGEDPAHCSVSDPGEGAASLRVEITRGDAPARLLGAMRRADPHLGGTLMSPLGNSRSAVLKTSKGTAVASGYLACGKSGAGSEAADRLTVVMAAVRDGSGSPLDQPFQRARLARVLAGTLDSTAEKWDCGGTGSAADGKITEVPEDTTRTLKAAGSATGTCEGIASAVFEAVADGAAPVEDCVLTDDAGNRLFQLSAYYGPYVKAARLETVRGKRYLTGTGGTGGTGGTDGVYWTTADCPDGEALYAVETVRDEEAGAFRAADPKLQRAALKTFATNSARRHGCPAPVSPAAD
ncbi:hypothetical protein OG413_09235 [Streptomyces sp. NBC_01433]|uniref:hypothetical protein n=1 Tax=Streptomyces sp. NBC_01433 TaxID=2903864 RepID=UPI0022581752|nr:hypothetical protein [Streptomyces sp. NBC_01433]MCX4675498.1 hypothetical protein [Streptomyces sp. NBC_01433]